VKMSYPKLKHQIRRFEISNAGTLFLLGITVALCTLGKLAINALGTSLSGSDMTPTILFGMIGTTIILAQSIRVSTSEIDPCMAEELRKDPAYQSTIKRFSRKCAGNLRASTQIAAVILTHAIQSTYDVPDFHMVEKLKSDPACQRVVDDLTENIMDDSEVALQVRVRKSRTKQHRTPLKGRHNN